MDGKLSKPPPQEIDGGYKRAWGLGKNSQIGPLAACGDVLAMTLALGKYPTYWCDVKYEE
jgi:hypothetical protein